jgi:hypothetical protein
MHNSGCNTSEKHQVVYRSFVRDFRLQRAEDVRTAKEPGELRIDWTGVARPDYEKARLATEQPPRGSGFVLTNPEYREGFRVCTCGS